MPTLVTGFSSFPGVADNVTERFIRHARAQALFAAGTRSVVFPVSYDIVERRLAGVLAASAPELVVALGADTSGPSIRVEAHAYNASNPLQADATGRRPRKRISHAAPERLATRLCARSVAEEGARRGLEVVASNDPGRYVCNFLYFKLLEHCAATETSCVFVHVPQRIGDDPARGFADVLTLVNIVAAHHRG